ncbi:MAG: sigma-70 family RNA polymerase sigma factor [Candidatus Poribacteria bacterium]|nr:sigma-70 family RNA polymerase sigma factor [Candidatus Poribacteria bacterium]
MKNDDSELIQRTLEGDQHAFAQLVDKYQEQVHTLAWQKIGDFHIAQEITQDVFITAYQKFSTLTHYRQFAGWLYVVTNRKCIAWHRKKKIETQSIDETDPIELEEAYYSEHIAQQREEAATEKRRTIVHKLLSKLKESDRTVMSLYYLAEMSCEEISEFFGVSPNTVRSRLHRARNRLKKEEAVIQENLSSFQLPTQLTENIMKEISHLNPVTPSGSKPLVPLTISAASAILVVLLIGFGAQNLIRFQKPYSLEATSKPTIEIVDAPIVLESTAKPAVNNQVGRSEVLSNNDGTGQKPDTSLFAAAQSDDAEISTSKAQWGQTNGPYGGYIGQLFATSEGILFAGTDGAGIFRSTDGGESWTPVLTGLHYASGFFMDVTALAQKRDTLYFSMVTGLFASTDDGNTWQKVPEPQWPTSTTSILVIEDRIYIGTIRAGIWYTDDSVSWIPVNDGLTNLKINELANIGTTLVVGTKEGGAFRKKATEDSWHPINSGFTVQPINQEQTNNAQTESGLRSSQRPQLPSKIRVDSFAVMDNLLFVGAVWDKGGGLFRSDDEGDTWTRIAAEEITDTVRTLAASGTTLYAGTSNSGIFRSDDRGDSWIAVNNGLTHREISTLLAVNENTVFAGTQVGVFRTTDSGNSWVETNTGLTNTSVSDFEVVGNKIYANFSTNIGGKIVRSVDGGESWQSVTMPIEYSWPTLSVSDGELYICAYRDDPRDEKGGFAGVFRLDEENNALIELFAQSHLEHTACMETVGTTFYMGTWDGGVLRYQWERDSFPEVTNLGLDGHNISMLSVNRKLIYAITGDNEIYRLQDEGRPWERIHLPDMADDDITDISYVTGIRWVGSVLYITSDQGVFSSINGGHTWTSINDGLNGTFISSIGTDGTDLYVGTTERGVYRWIEDKKKWKQLGSLRRQVLSLAVLDGFLYAGTVSGGVFRIKIEK